MVMLRLWLATTVALASEPPSIERVPEESGVLLQGSRLIDFKVKEEEQQEQNRADRRRRGGSDYVGDGCKDADEPLPNMTCTQAEERFTCANPTVKKKCRWMCCQCNSQRGQIIAVGGNGKLMHAPLCTTESFLDGSDLYFKEMPRVSELSDAKGETVKDFLMHRDDNNVDYIYAITKSPGISGNFGLVKWGTWCNFLSKENWKWKIFDNQQPVHEIRIYKDKVYGLNNRIYEKTAYSAVGKGGFKRASACCISHFDIDDVEGVVYGTTDWSNKVTSQKLSTMTESTKWHGKAHGRHWRSTAVLRMDGGGGGYLYAISFRRKIWRQNLHDFDWRNNGYSRASWELVDGSQRAKSIGFYSDFLFKADNHNHDLYKKLLSKPEHEFHPQAIGGIDHFTIEAPKPYCITHRYLESDDNDGVRPGSMHGDWKPFQSFAAGEEYKIISTVSTSRGNTFKRTVGTSFSASVTVGYTYTHSKVHEFAVSGSTGVGKQWTKEWGETYNEVTADAKWRTYKGTEGFPYMWQWVLIGEAMKDLSEFSLDTTYLARSKTSLYKPKCYPDCYQSGDLSYQTCQSANACSPCGWLPEHMTVNKSGSFCPSDSPEVASGVWKR